jgi:ribosomal protein L37E
VKRFLRWLILGIKCKRCGEVTREMHWSEDLCLTCGFVEAIKRTMVGRDSQ